MTKTSMFTERLDLSEAQLDTTERVIRNVVLIRAGMSKNRRNYPEAVLQASVPVFEGAKAYDGHETRARRVAETTGYYKNVRYEEGAIRADRYFTRTQAGNDVYAIAEDILSGRAPATLAGLSINAVGKGKTVKHADGDFLDVESITAANSVDDVDNPAAGGTYLAANAEGDALTQAFFRDLTIEEWTQARPDYLERLQNEWKNMREGEKVKAAKAEADHNRTALEEASATIEQLNADLEAARRETAAARQEAAIDVLLAKSALPETWKTDLRTALLEAAPNQWDGILERELRKAQVAGHNPRVPVSGADQQVHPPVMVVERRAPSYAQVRTPEEHAAYVKQLQETR